MALPCSCERADCLLLAIEIYRASIYLREDDFEVARNAEGASIVRPRVSRFRKFAERSTLPARCALQKRSLEPLVSTV